MSDMKCPFCQQKLDRDLKGECGCINEKCQKSVFMFGSEELWQELIRTRKALEVAVDALRHADWFFDGDYIVYTKDMHNEIRFAIKAIEQITALEQKE